jgi:hypothetical protein
MLALAWIASLLVVGLLVGFGTGALLLFTGGRVRWDLVAGQVGALAAGLGFHFVAASPDSSGLLPISVAGLAGAILVTWVTRMLMWPPPPKFRAPQRRPDRAGTVVMTSDDATQLWFSERRLITADRRQ